MYWIVSKGLGVLIPGRKRRHEDLGLLVYGQLRGLWTTDKDEI